MGGGDAGWQNDAVIIRVHHNERSNETGADAPAGGPRMRELAVASLKFDARGLGEVLPEEVGGAGLDRLAVLHHCLDAIGANGTREPLTLAFLAGEHGQREPIAGEGFIHAEHFHRFLLRLFAGLVGGVALLPEELGGAQEQPGAHFPADDIRPLVEKDREVAPGFDPAGVGRADDGLRGRADDERLGEFARRHEFPFAHLEPVVRDDGAFLREPLHMRRLFLEVAQRNEEREVGIAMAGRFEHSVQHRLHALPDRVAPWLHDHATAHLRVLGEVRRADDLLIPLWKILSPLRGDGCLLFFAHGGRMIAAAPRR